MRLLLALLIGAVSARWLCSNGAPSDALRGALSACRALDYAFCVDAAENEFDVENAARGADESIAIRYSIATNGETQRCAYAWLAAACSDAFRRQATALPCASTCAAVQRECGDDGNPFECTQNAQCTDYLSGGALCALAEADERDESVVADSPAPPPPPAAPRQSPPSFGRSGGGARERGADIALLLFCALVCLVQ